MVQFFNVGMSPRDQMMQQLGLAVGQGISKNFVPPEQAVQRDLILKSLNAAKTKMAGAKNPADAIFALIEGTAGIPGAEKYIGQIAPLLMSQLSGERGGTVGAPGMGQPGEYGQVPQEGMTRTGAKQLPGQVQPQQAQQQPTVNAQDYLQMQNQKGMNLPEPTYIPPIESELEPTQLGAGPIPRQYTPEQIIQARNEDRAQGFPDSPRAATMQEYNEMARKQVADVVQGAQAQAQLGGARREGQQAFRNELINQIGSNDPNDIALAENIAQHEKYRNISNDVIRANRVAKEYEQVKRNMNSIDGLAERPDRFLRPGVYDEAVKSLQDAVKNPIEYGLRGDIYKKLSAKGWTRSEIEHIMNPLDSKVKQDIANIGRTPQKNVGFGREGVPAGKDEQIIKQQIKKLDSVLEKNIKPGEFNPKTQDVIKPGTSLILMRNEAMKKGISWIDFKNSVTRLKKEGKITLDPMQENELIEISNSPVHTLSIGEFLWGTK